MEEVRFWSSIGMVLALITALVYMIFAFWLGMFFCILWLKVDGTIAVISVIFFIAAEIIDP